MYILLLMLLTIGLLEPRLFCLMLCVSVRIDILSRAEAGFELDARFRFFFIDNFHSLFLVFSCPFLNTPAAVALPQAVIHTAGCICG